MIDWEVMTDAQINRELERGRVTMDQRRVRETAPDQMENLNRKYLAAQGIVPKEPWRQPAGAHDAYPEDWKVEHNGTMWESLVPGNVYEPGVSAWRETTADDPNAPAPEWIIPTGAHDAYKAGDAVTYGGRTWRSESSVNVWRPGEFGWVIVETPIMEPDPSEPLPAPETYPAWEPGMDVAVGERYVYKGTVYEVRQGHATLLGWEPPAVASLWKGIAAT